MRYKFHTLYELDNLAVVNVKDTNVVKNTFKLLMFPDTRLFQAESPKAKVRTHLNYDSCLMIPGCSRRKAPRPRLEHI